jgi:hypothetical protein
MKEKLNEMEKLQSSQQPQLLPYTTQEKFYFLILILITSPRPIPTESTIHTGWELNKKIFRTTPRGPETLEDTSHVDTVERPDYVYHKYISNAPGDDANIFFSLKAGIPNVVGDGVRVVWYLRKTDERKRRAELEEKIMPIEVSKYVEQWKWKGMLAQGVEPDVEEKEGKKVTRLTLRDGTNVWFEVEDVNVKYEHQVAVAITGREKTGNSVTGSR